MTRCPASCCSVRFSGAAGELDGVAGGFGVDELEDEDGAEEDEEDDDEVVVGVEDEDVVVGVGVDRVVVDEELELPCAAGFDALLEHAPLSNPTAATSVTAAMPPVFLPRPLRIPASAMVSTLANAGLRCQPDGPFRCVARARRSGYRG